MKPTATPPEIATHDPGEIAGLWAEAKSLFFAADFPPYASPAWRALHPDDPRRLAAALDAAESWRKYGDDVVQWLRDAYDTRPAIHSRKTLEEIEAARQPKPPRQLHATWGWPPIAIPGQPGRWLTHRQEMAA